MRCVLALLLVLTAQSAAAAEPIRIVIVGDYTSIDYGTQAFPSRLPAALAARGIEAEVQTRPEHLLGQAPLVWPRFDAEVLADQPDLVILQLGASDAVVQDDEPRAPTVPQHLFRRYLDLMITAAHQRGARVVLMTPFPMFWDDFSRAVAGGAPYQAGDRWGLNVFNAAYAETVRELARQHDAPLVDVYRMCEEIDAKDDVTALFMGHVPTDAAHAMVTDALAATIDELHGPDGLTPLPPRGYSIPLVDLDAHAHRQVVVDREPGQYLGHPTTVLLDDGRTIIVVYPKGHGRGAIVMKRSIDGGRTWSDRLDVPASWATSKETPTIHLLRKPGGPRLVLFSGLYPARRAISDDEGATWSELEPVGDWGGIVVMSSVLVRHGRTIALFHDDGRFIAGQGRATGVFTLYQSTSDDGGLTWMDPVPIWTGDHVHLCEPGIVRSPDGRRLAILLRENR
ncbi:MAG: exo-alpha-sialidase, partial [Planctomycetota bacterium]